jgi:hypothetical protein
LPGGSGGSAVDGGLAVAVSITESSIYYAGGGGGGALGLGGGTAITANKGGAGNSGNPGGSGTSNTGGGGGSAGRLTGGSAAGGSGGSGVVIIRYADTYPAATTTGSPTVTVTGGYRIYTFTGSGSITF